ncbi:MAG: hypothetical protein ACOC44_06865 [Promethearchaeia archaeon]
MTILSPVKETVVGITENKNTHSNISNVLFVIKIKINWGWTVKLCLEPYYDGDDDEKNKKQRETIEVQLFQRVEVGETVAKILYENERSHLHYQLNSVSTDYCPYEYSSEEAKEIFDQYPVARNESICIPV